MGNASLQVERSPAGFMTKVRWTQVAPVLGVIWVLGMVDKIGVAVIATNKTFLLQMGLVGKPALIGLLVSVLLFAYGIGFPIWGLLVDRFGPRKCAMVGLVLWAASTALAAMATSFAFLLISRGLLGLAEAFTWPMSNSITARWFPLSERGRAKSIWINGINVGFALSGFVVNGLIGPFGWRGVFWFLTGAAIVICLPLVAIFLRDDPARSNRVSQAELAHIQTEQIDVTVNADKVKTIGSSSFWMVVLAFMGSTMGVFGLAAWFPTYVSTVKHFSHATTSNFILLAFGVALLATIYVGRHVDKFHRKALWNLVGFTGAIIALIITEFTTSTILDVLLISVAIVFIQGITTLIGHGLMHSFTATGHMGRDNGVMVGITNILAAFAPTAMGALIGLGGYSMAFDFLIVMFAIAWVGSFVLRRQGY